MNILFHCWQYPPHGGGVGRYIRNMSEALVKAGNHVVIASGTANGVPEHEVTNGVHIHRVIQKEEIYTLKCSDRILAIAEKNFIEVIEGADHLGSSSRLVARRDRPPVVIKCHSCTILYAAHEKAHTVYPWQKYLIKLARLKNYRQALHERRSIEHADLLMAPSFKIIEEMRNQGLRLPEKQLVIPNPIEIGRFESQESSEPKILFIGRLDIGKGIQFLPEILRKVREKHPTVKLEIAGGDSYARGLGSLQKWLEGQFGEDGNNIIWRGLLTETEVNSAIDNAWVVVVPSRWDTFPTVLLESMARRKALVVSDKGGIPEMVKGSDIPVCDPSKAGFADAVVELLSDSGKRMQVGRSGQEKAQACYSPDKIADLYTRTLLESKIL